MQQLLVRKSTRTLKLAEQRQIFLKAAFDGMRSASCWLYVLP
jgi:hypothetical protein